MMKVLAVRDDGARLIGDPQLSHAVLQSEDGSAVLPVASILARGYWQDGDGSDVELRPEVEERIRQASAEWKS